MAAYLGYTLWMKTLFRGWPIMAHDTHTRRRMAKLHVSKTEISELWTEILIVVHIVKMLVFLENNAEIFFFKLRKIITSKAKTEYI